MEIRLKSWLCRGLWTLVAGLGCAGGAQAFVLSTCVGGAVCASPPGTPTEGWDGPGLGSFTLSYYLGNPNRADDGLGGLNIADIDAAFAAAAATWSSVAQVAFVKIGDATNPAQDGNFLAANSIDFYFHGGPDATDGFPFDGPWNPATGAGAVFAHAWGPQDIQNGNVAGNMHFDMDESWVTNAALIGVNSATIDLESVILHELGHVLGLDHEDGLGQGLGAPVMQSLYWGEKRALTADDIAGVQSLYCPTGQVCGTIPEPATLLLLGSGLAAFGMSRRRG